MELADMCIRASKTSFLYGKDVVLEGLKSADMNGQKGVVGGYDPDTDRRSVYVPEVSKEVWIKPQNITLANGEKMEKKLNLVDVADRFGNAALFEVSSS
ncbi:unnamed protein product [Cylindrotheca closterium]|uniref:Uncharacterized protein n=1 Tax=Cylindrotheca closterium TaxID=2856 RepID=A0AAD2CBM8_9STRA|nr:unnamed protein product [Cylindrotheca closterium]